MVKQLSSVLLIGPKPERKIRYSRISIDSFFMEFPTVETYKRMQIGAYDSIIALSDNKWSMKQAEKTRMRLADRNIRVPILETESSNLYDFLCRLNEGMKVTFDRWNHNILHSPSMESSEKNFGLLVTQRIDNLSSIDNLFESGWQDIILDNKPWTYDCIDIAFQCMNLYAGPAQSTRERFRVMCIDKSEYVRNFAEYVFNQAGHRITTKFSGIQAKKKDLDLIIMNIKESGSRLFRQAVRDQIPIILLNGLHRQTRWKAIEKATYVLDKPLSANRLITASAYALDGEFLVPPPVAPDPLGKVFILLGYQTSGKTRLARLLTKYVPGSVVYVPYKTRRLRWDEHNGYDAWRVSKQQFRQMTRRGLLGYSMVRETKVGRRYRNYSSFPLPEPGKDILFPVGFDGYKRVRQYYSDYHIPIHTILIGAGVKSIVLRTQRKRLIHEQLTPEIATKYLLKNQDFISQLDDLDLYLNNDAPDTLYKNWPIETQIRTLRKCVAMACAYINHIRTRGRD